ncbi:MAG: hypothetical protein EA341_04700 [Mongoliibacter sp.]|uniref:hypothetical protein n=1 Tax=Mongoliibacter sp. TaxID=2022438 RepID=UPI0012F38DD5|nr:hypothetical protein [Mongoliibacter sp.]TVP51685.1 MAG: hypothetical protein EA341_04700 [Mongoliibacter sp.]
MDAGNIIYIIAIIIYFIYTALKKGKGPDDVAAPEQKEEGQSKRPASFEDLLKEIRDGQQERERDFDQSGQGDTLEKKPTRQDRSIEKPVATPSYQRPSIDQPKAFGRFQGEVSDDEKPRHKTLDEQVRLDAEIEGLKSSIAVEEISKPKKSNKYRAMLKNPESVKDAIVLSEILNKRSF